MSSGTALTKKYWRQTFLNIFVMLVIGFVVIIFTSSFAGDLTKKDLKDKAQETLAVQAETLTGVLDKYSLLSAVLANGDDVFTRLVAFEVKNTTSLGQITSRAAAASGALDVVLARPNGEVISPGLGVVTGYLDIDASMMEAALEGRLGRGVEVLDENKRAYVFTSGIRLKEKYIGVVAVYVGLDELEDNWSLSSMPIFAISENGRIVMSNQSEWRLRDIEDVVSSHNKRRFFDVNGIKKEYIDISKKLSLLNWELHVLADVAPIRVAKILWGGLAGLFVFLIAIGIQTLINRLHDVLRRERSDKATSLRLERIVRDRTSELLKTNDFLASEVEERRQAEESLRKTQNELVQTGKLAALGQMSTALSHEYNQPLSATKSYADNAIKYLKRNRIKEATENIVRISGLADRMADISKTLRNFARKPNQSFGLVPLKAIIDETLEILSARIKADSAKVDVTFFDDEILVRAGHVRLQQVLVNLIINALDAMKGKNDKKILINISQIKKQVIIKVIDFGDGIKSENINNIFDPFFTTKEVGEGLGLGLSISFNIIKDFGGRLSVKNHEGGGAEFSILLFGSENSREIK